MSRRYRYGLLAGVAASALFHPATAQVADEAGVTADASDDVIVVTSRFREETVQDIGASVTGITGDALRAQGLQDLDDVARVVPGLQSIKSRQNSNDIAIRGIISAGSGRETSSVFSVYVDEVSVAGAGNLRDFSSADLNRIEVIRGPQPTLYGEGAVGGVIRYFTNDPDLSGPSFTGTLRGQYEQIDEGGIAYSAENATSIILSPGKVGLRVSAFTRDDDGFIDNPDVGEDTNDFESYGGRAVLLAQPTPFLEIRLSAFLSRDESGESNQIDPGSDPEDLTLSVAPISGSYTDEFDLYSGKVSYELNSLTLQSITGYYNREFTQALFSSGNTFGLAPFFPDVDTLSFNAGDDSFEQWSQEFRVISDFDGPLNFTAGAYFREREQVLAQLLSCAGCIEITDPATDEIAAERTETTTEQISGFAELTYAVSEDLRLIGGVRYVSDKVTATLLQNNVISLVPRFDGDGGLIPWTPSDPIGFSNILDALEGAGFSNVFEFELDKFLPRAGVEWDVTDDILLYGNAALGARNGGVGNAISALGVSGGDPDVFFDNLTFDEDTVLSVEAGVKSSWLNGDLTANLGVFQTTYEDTQIAVNTPANNTINGPDQTLTGLELETSYRVNDLLTTFFNTSYIDAEFDDGQVISPAPAGADLPYFDLASGNRPADIPEWTYAAGYSFGKPLGRGGVVLTSTGSFQYLGERFSSVQNFPTTELDPLEYLNLSLGLENDVWSLDVYGTNLLNDVQAISIGANPLQQTLTDGVLDAPVISTSVSRPRTVGVRFGLRY